MASILTTRIWVAQPHRVDHLETQIILDPIQTRGSSNVRSIVSLIGPLGRPSGVPISEQLTPHGRPRCL